MSLTDQHYIGDHRRGFRHCIGDHRSGFFPPTALYVLPVPKSRNLDARLNLSLQAQALTRVSLLFTPVSPWSAWPPFTALGLATWEGLAVPCEERRTRVG